MMPPQRVRLPDVRVGFTHSFEIMASKGPTKFELTCNCYPDYTLGEFFLRVGKEGSLIKSTLDGHAISVSIGLQHGVPLHVYTSKMRYTQFDPAGMVAGMPRAMHSEVADHFFKSPFDYVAAYLDWKFPDGKLRVEDRAAPTLPVEKLDEPEG